MFLVTTANRKYWKTDEKILFLGEWCKIYSEKHIWSNIDYETLPSPWNKYQQLDSHFTYLEDIYEKYLKVFASNLNNYHNEDHSIKYWRIIIGPWLYRFITVIYDRYLSIKSAIDFNRVTNTWIPDLKPDRWVPVSSYDLLSLACANNNYNLYLYGRLITKLGRIPFKIKEDKSFLNPLDLPEFKHVTSVENKKTIIRDFIQISEKYIPDRFYKIMFFSTGISFWNNIKLLFSLGQLPFVIPQFYPFRAPIEKNLRKNIKVPEETNEFESILNDLVTEQLPISFFEGYLATRDKSVGIYPKRTKLILTSNRMGMHPDEGFRFWVANQVEKGVKLILIQHGGGYGLCNTFTEKHELEICSKFFSWGWGGEQPKISPMTIIKNIDRSNIISANGKILSVISATTPFVPGADQVTTGNVFCFSHNYILQQKRFLNAVCPEVCKLLLLRPFKDVGLNEVGQMTDMYPSIKIYKGDAPLIKQLRESRLCIHGYFGTSWLETLSMNFPTVVFWDLNRVRTLLSVQPYLDDLRRLKILHDTPESAAEFINEIYEDPLPWWMSSELQKVNNKFCHLFARTSKNWMKEWKQELIKLIK